MPNCKAGELGLLSAKPHSLIKSASLTMALYFLFSILFMGNAWAQAKKVTGTVTDGENGQPLVGASVTVRGKSASAVTDATGTFVIDAADGDIIEVSNVGFKASETRADLAGAMNIKLAATNRELGEVIVVGYGTQKKSDVTGSVASVPKNRFTQLPVTNVMQAIQ